MDTTFAELGLDEHILRGVETLGFTDPTPVQQQAIPLVLQGRDIVASAQTGTGKTAAFTLPVLQLIGRIGENAPVQKGEGGAASESPEASVPPVDAEPELPAIVASAPGTEPSAEAVPAAEPSTEAATSAKPKRRHKHRKKDAGADSQPSEPDAEDVQETEASPVIPDVPILTDASPAEDAPSAEDAPDAPKKRRRRRRKKSSAQGDAQANTADTAPFDPNADRGPHALVVTPTRELAQQIDDVARAVTQQTGQRVVTVIGGERYDRQVKGLARGCDMLVATPGRLLDLMERKAVDLGHVQVLVLDEADRMLDMGFWPSVRRIIASLPRERQTLLFSATISADIQTSMPTMLHDPATVEIARVGTTAETVEQRLVAVVQGQKVSLLTHVIAAENPGRTLIFCRTKQRVDSVAAALQKAGLEVGVMHADRRQRDREKALTGFREGKLRALVATDVMSRGIDVQGIDLVVNFDVPLDPEDYVHRIGRTGRAGQAGLAVTFMAPDEVTPLREIEYFTKKLVPSWEPADFEFAAGRIVPNEKRATSRSQRSMFSGARSRGRGPSGGRFGRHT